MTDAPSSPPITSLTLAPTLALVALAAPHDRLLAACRDGDETTMRELLTLHPELLNAPREANRMQLGDTPLVSACRHNHVALATTLLELGADPNAATHNGTTPLLVAVKHHLHAVIDLLLTRGANANVAAVSDGRATTGAASLPLIRYQKLPLHHLISGVNINAMHMTDKLTPLRVATKNGDFDSVVMLLAHGADTNAPDRNAMTPLLHASKRSDLSIVAELLQHGADVRYTSNIGYTALHLAVAHEHDLIVRMLLAEGASLEAVDHNGLTPLHYATVLHHTAIVTQLLVAGADVDRPDSKGKPSLYLAATRGFTDVVTVLLTHGADIEATTDPDNERALHAACIAPMFRPADSTLELLQRGANVNAVDAAGATPLHIAVRNGNKAIVAALLAHSADIDARDLYGRNALDCARESDQELIVATLLAAKWWPNEYSMCVLRSTT